MTVPYLKDIVGQAKLYVRPDKNIEDMPTEEESVEVTMCISVAIYAYVKYYIRVYRHKRGLEIQPILGSVQTQVHHPVKQLVTIEKAHHPVHNYSQYIVKLSSLAMRAS